MCQGEVIVVYHFSDLWIAEYWEACFELHLSIHLLLL